MLRRARDKTRFAEALLVAALIVGMAAGEIIVPLLWSSPAFAGGNGNGGGNGNAGGNGNGGPGGKGNASGNSGAKSNAGGNGKGQPKGAVSDTTAAPEIETPNDALGLLESGRIHSLADVYRVAEQQFGGEVIAASLVAQGERSWVYDLRIVTDDGYVRNVAYDATTLALISMIDNPAE